MSNPDKRWSWGAAVGRATGAATGGAATGAVMGSLGGPVGPVIGAAIGAAGAFGGSFVGSALGHWWDDRFDVESFGSAALYSMVVSGGLAALFALLALPVLATRAEVALQGLFAVCALAGFLGSASRSLIDDFRAAAERRKLE